MRSIESINREVRRFIISYEHDERDKKPLEKLINA